MHAHTNACTHAHTIHTYVCTHAYACTHMHTHNAFICIYTHIHTYIHTFAHTHKGMKPESIGHRNPSWRLEVLLPE